MSKTDIFTRYNFDTNQKQLRPSGFLRNLAPWTGWGLQGYFPNVLKYTENLIAANFRL